MEQFEHNNRPWNMDINQYNALMHLAQLAGFIFPLVGMALPIYMWISNKEKHPSIDENGRNIVNFIITCLILFGIAFILSFLIIGIPLFIVLGFAVIVLPIIGAVRATNGRIYKYPFTYEFI